MIELIQKTITTILLVTILMGCNNSVKDAKAHAVRQATQRTNDRHALAMADSESLTPVRLFVKAGLWMALLAGGIILILGASSSFSFYLIGIARNLVKFHRVPLDTQTRQYPLLIYGNGRRAFNPNNGERLLLSDVSNAQLERIEANTKVQMAGLLPNKVIDARRYD